MITQHTSGYPLPFHDTWNQLDSSKLQEFCDCPRKFFFRYVLGWIPDRPNNHLSFGSAWHDAMEHLSLNGFSEQALRGAFESFMQTYRKTFPIETDADMAPKDPGNAFAALTAYTERYKNEQNKTLYTEVSFKVPLDDEGTEIVGRIDRIYRSTNDGKLRLMDHKTGQRVDRLWEQQWNLSIQMGTYYHAALCCFEPSDFAGIVVDGTFFKKSGNEFKQKIVQKSVEMCEAWLQDTLFWTSLLKEQFEFLHACDSPSYATMHSFPRNTQSCTKYFGCPFLDICSVWPNPLARCEAPPPGFKQEFWNPEVREKPAKAFISEGEIKEAKDA